MTIKAILRNGSILPLDPLPSEWAEGKELVVEDPAQAAPEDIAQWEQEVETAVIRLPPEEHERFFKALNEIERQSKEAIRKEWGLS